MIMAKKVSSPGPRDERGVLAARILTVARDSFAENGFAGTTIRAVARAAEVDPALVHHYFGSKEALLEACTNPPENWFPQVAAMWTNTPTDQLGIRLVQFMLANWANDEVRPVLRSVLLTAAHDPRIREKLTATVAAQLMGPATFGLTDKERMTRSGLVASQLIGLALMRFVWQIEPIASMTDAEVVAALAPTIQRYADGEISEQPASA